MPASRVDVRELQRPIRERYTADPTAAPRVVSVRSGTSDLADPLHCEVRPEGSQGVVWRTGAHAAVGGDGDTPCSADLLLAALAACQEITLRMVAANQGIDLDELEVVVEGDWDPRGTLGMGREFPIGLTSIRSRTRVRVGADVDGERAERFVRSAERYCVVLDTLRSGVPVDSRIEVETAG